MDPDKALEILRDAVEAWQGGKLIADDDTMERILLTFESLDHWITKKRGHLPQAWE